MKNLIRRVAASGTPVRARVKIGSNCIDLVDDGARKLLLNGYETAVCDGAVQDESYVALVVDMLSKIMSSGVSKVVVMTDGGSDGLIRSVAERLKGKIGKPSVKFESNESEGLTVSPADHKVDGVVNTEALAKNASVLADKVVKVADAIVSVHDAALMMTRKHLVKSMWGANRIQDILEGVKSRLEDPGLPWSKVASCADVLSKSSLRLRRKMSSEDPEDVRMVTNVLIPNINDGYATLKSASESAAVSFVPLVYIDDICKEATTYPATWFFDETVIDSLSRGYDGVLDFLVQVPVMEAKAIDPLSSIRMKIINSSE